MGAAAGPIALGLMVAGTVKGAIDQKNALNAQAGRDTENARLSIMDGEIEAQAVRDAARASDGEAIVAQGASGVAVGSGSALDVLKQSAFNRELGVINRRYAASGQAAALYDQARQNRKAGRSALFSGVLRAGAQALTGYSQMSGQQAAQARYDRTRVPVVPGGMRLPMPGGY